MVQLVYPHARPSPDVKLAAMGPNRLASSVSSVIRRGQPDSGESCIMLQSELIRSLDAKFPQYSVIACSRVTIINTRTLKKRCALAARTDQSSKHKNCRIGELMFDN